LATGFAQAPGDAGTVVSRNPPERYTKEVAPLLTSLEKALEISKSLKPDPEFGGAVILNELVHHVDDSGARIVVLHSIYRADSEAGAQSLTDDTQSFRSASQRIHLALAQTISPDGTRTPVRPNATLIQSPQRQASQSLYSDAKELVIIYPKIKVGTLTESIVVIEEDEMRVPGEFMTSAIWVSGWPQGQRRVAIDLPEKMGKRLRFSQLGTGAPDPKKTEPKPGRMRFDMVQQRSPAYNYEVGRPPVSHSGPATWITTFADWDAFADWYRPLIKDRATLKPKLAKKVDEWTKGAKDENEIIARLLKHCSTDVRYTGLEFGISGLQPYDCNEVWENQYGDCKDKANLLRAMLAHKGIKSYLTLLNTDHAGRIEKRSPDYRQFDHAILAIELADGSLQFNDPTIEFARPGLISPDDADREVLLIREDRAQFARTPPATAGKMHYEFDLDLKPSREISGWLTLHCTGFYAASYSSFFEKKDAQALNRSLSGMIGGFFLDAEVIDTEKPKSGSGETYQIRAFFVAPGSQARGDSKQLRLTFPHSNGIFPDLGDSKERSAPFYGWAEESTVDAKISVPAALGSPDLPRPFAVDSSAVSGSANWTFEEEKNTYRAKLALDVKKALLSADEFKVAFGAVSSMRSWLSAPLIFDARKARPEPADPDGEELANFPLMPTGLGQLNLLEQRFPSDGNRVQRRAALEKVLQFFPNDQVTQFTAESKLAELDWNEEKLTAAIGRLQRLLNSEASDAVDGEDRAWAEYVLAFCFRDDGQNDKAARLLRDVAEDAGISDFRRSWAGYQRLAILKRQEAPDYLKLAEESGGLIDFDTEARPFLIALHCEFMTRAGKPGTLADMLASIATQKSENLPQILELIAEVARELPSKMSDQLAAVFRSLPVEEGTAAAGIYATEMANFDKHRQSASSYAAIQERLKQFVEKNRPDNWDETMPAGEFKTRDDFEQRLETLEGGRKIASYMRLGSEYLTRFVPNERFAYFLWRTAAWSDFSERTNQQFFKEPALPTLLDLCDLLPRTSDYYTEGRFLRAQSLMQEKKHAEEAAIYSEMLESEDISEAFILAATHRLGIALERSGKFDAAHERYLTLRPRCGEFPLANDALLRAVLIDLNRGNILSACDLIDHLSKTEENVMDLADDRAQIRSMIAMKDPESYWIESAKWWDAWVKLREQFLGSDFTNPEPLPVVGQLQARGSIMRAAVQGKDVETFYQQLDILLQALRWSPAYINDSGSSVSFLATTISEESESELRAFFLKIAEHFPNPTIQHQRQLQLFQAINLLDSDRAEEALVVVKKFFESPGKRTPVFFTMTRLWAMAAGRTEDADLTAPAEAMEKILATSDNDDSRTQNVLHLANLYNQLKRLEDEEALLERELEHPAIKGDEDSTARLTRRYESLAREGSGGKKFTAAVDRWRDKHAPKWLASCPPLTLEDPRIGDNLERAIEESGSRFSIEEQIKFNLLAARSDQLSIDQRDQAFYTAFIELLNDALTHKEARAMTLTALEDEGFTRDARQLVLLSALNDAVDQRRPGDITFYLSHPSFDRDNPRFKDLREYYEQLASLKFDSAESINKAFERFTAGEIENLQIGGISICFGHLLELGDLESAEAIYKDISNWNLGTDVRETKSALKLRFLKYLKIARKSIPAFEKMRVALEPMLDLETAGEPEWLSKRRRRYDEDDLTIAQLKEWRLHQARIQDYDRSRPGFWYNVADAIQSPESVDFAVKMVETCLESYDDDSVRARVIRLSPMFADTDEPSVRDRYAEIFRPYRDLKNAPLTRDSIRMYEIRTDVRAGKEIDMQQAFESLQHPGAQALQTRLELTQLLQKEDPARLKNFLEAMSADQLVDVDYLPLTIPALAMAGLPDEADLARETATEEIPKLVARGWRDPSFHAHIRAYQLAEIIERPELIPEGIVEDLLARKVKNERPQLSLKISH